jgi:TolB-like protein/DNA-binding winged helix-turn-helix (wHTH) protein
MTINIGNGFRIGEWQAFPLQNEIRGPAGNEHLEPIVMQVLTCLAENAGDVVERDELLESIWNSRAFSYEPLNRCIFELRKKLGDNPKRPKYIQTVPKRGYRLICEVAPLDSGDNKGGIKHDVPLATPGRFGRLPGWRPGILAGLGALVAIAAFLSIPGQVPDYDSASGIGVVGSTIAKTPYHSVAVLPFRDYGRDGNHAFFVDSVHEEIISQLSQLSSLESVISRTSVERFRDTDDSLPDIAGMLGVMHILQGSVQRVGDRVRVNVQLINAEGEQQLWESSYERTLTPDNIFDIQKDISQAVANALQIVMTDQESSRLETRRPSSLAAYRNYVLGRLELLNQNAAALERAQQFFETAIDHDPGYALAYVGLADAIAMQTVYGGRLSMESLPERREAIEQALSLNPNLGEAYASMGWLVSHESGMAAAEEHFARAIELSPNYQLAHQLNAQFLLWANRPEEALLHAEKAFALSPIDPSSTNILAAILQRLDRNEEALVHTRAAIELNPRVPLLYSSMAEILLGWQQIGKAQAWKRAGVLQAEPDRSLFQNYCSGYLLLIMHSEAAECLDELKTRFPEFDSAWAAVDLHGAKGDYQHAADLAERIVADDPSWGNRYFLAWSYLDNQDFSKAYKLLEELLPDYFTTSELTIGFRDTKLAGFVGYVMYERGEIERAEYIFTKALEALTPVYDELHLQGRDQDFEDILIYVTRGQKQEAVTALRTSIDGGMINPIWFRSPMYDAMKTEPEWNSLLDELDQFIARERDWYERHKDDYLEVGL